DRATALALLLGVGDPLRRGTECTARPASGHPRGRRAACGADGAREAGALGGCDHSEAAVQALVYVRAERARTGPKGELPGDGRAGLHAGLLVDPRSRQVEIVQRRTVLDGHVVPPRGQLLD